MESRLAPVAVVVVTWNAERFIVDCLGSLRALRRPPAEVVVVDNASADRTVDRVRAADPGAALSVLDHNAGFCRANNLGIVRTSSPFVLVLNPDTRLDPDFLEILLPAFGDPRVGIASGKLRRFDDRTLDSCGQRLGRSRQPIDRGYGRPDDGRFDADAEVFGACGAAALYRRTMLDAIADPGPCYFDEAFFAFNEDLDVAWRARRLGWIAVYRHRALGWHARGGSASAAPWIRRAAAMLGRPPAIRFHIVKNRYLAILRNDRLRDYLRDLPFIAARDLATFLLLLGANPSLLARLWRERSLFSGALAHRRLDAARPRHKVGLRAADDGGTDGG